MITNGTVFRVDRQTGTDPNCGPTYTDGQPVRFRCYFMPKAGEIYGDDTSEKQVRFPQMSRILVRVSQMPAVDAIIRSDRLTVAPDGRPQRAYIVERIWEHIGGSHLDHIEVAIRDA